MLGIVFTTPQEAAPFLDEYAGIRTEALSPGAPIEVGEVLVAVTGAGKINAALATERLLSNRDLGPLLHAGTCTGLSEDVPLGSVIGASFVVEGDRVELEAPVYPRMPLECPLSVDSEGTFVSQDHTREEQDDPSEDADAEQSQGYWERLADVRDDTSYAVAYVAAQHGTKCHIAKGVDAHRTEVADSEPQSARRAVARVLQTYLSESSDAA